MVIWDGDNYLKEADRELIKVTQSYSVFHGDYLYTELVLYLLLITGKTKDKYLQNLK